MTNATVGVPLVALLLAACLPGTSQAGVRQQVLAAQELRVCVVPDYAGISFRDPRTGALVGLDIDLSRQLAARLGVKARYVESDFITFPTQLAARQCDIAMMGIWVTSSRAARVAFSRPYLSSGAYAVVSRANTRIRSWQDVDRADTLLAVLDSPDLLARARNIVPNANVLKVPMPGKFGSGSTVSEVMSGRADAYLVDDSMAQQIKRNDGWARIIAPPRFVPLTDIAWAVPKGDADWLDTVNRFQAALRQDGTLGKMVERHGLALALAHD